MIPKNKAWRSRQYLAWVRNLPCCVCGRPADEAHHVTGVGHMGGTGTKAPDWAVMPICRKHHDELHRDPNLWPDQWEMIVRTIGTAIDEGVLK